MPPSDEPKSEEFAEYLEGDEQLLYAGHGQTGSIVQYYLSLVSRLWGGADNGNALKQWRVAVTDRRVLLVRRDSKEERTARFDQLTEIELKRSGGINRKLILRAQDAEDIELGLPAARNDYGELEQALNKAAPQLLVK